MFKVQYVDPQEQLFGGRYPYKSEEVIGYFKTIEEFKKAALERWSNKRDKVVFEDETEDGIKAYWEYLGMKARPFMIVSRVEPIGWLKHVTSV